MKFEYNEKEKMQIRFYSAIVILLFQIKRLSYFCKSINYPEQPCIFALWHAYQCGLYSIPDKGKTNVIVSRSKDGEIISRAANSVGIKTVRGSITRGGASATKAMIDRLKEGEFGAITVDGPKGPKHVVKKGIVEIAKISGLPIVPMTWHGDSKGFLQFNTWDGFCFPLFGLNLLSYYGDPIYVDKDADEAEIERIRKLLEDKMIEQDKYVRENFKTLIKQAKKAKKISTKKQG